MPDRDGLRSRLWLTAALAACVTAAACGGSSTRHSAEQLDSIAAEGALLAGRVAEGEVTAPFQETHAAALRAEAQAVASATASPALRRVGNLIATELQRLASAPGNIRLAANAERRLQRLSRRADAISGAGP